MKGIRSIFIVMLTLIVFHVAVFAQDFPTLGIMDIVAKQGVSTDDTSMLTDLIFHHTYHIGSDKYNIIARDLRDKLLEEHKIALSGLCDDVSCALEAGNYLAADYMMVGSFGQFGTNYHLTLQVVNVNTTKIDSSIRAKGESLDKIEKNIARNVKALFTPKEERALLYEKANSTAKFFSTTGMIALIGGISIFTWGLVGPLMSTMEIGEITTETGFYMMLGGLVVTPLGGLLHFEIAPKYSEEAEFWHSTL